MLKIIDLSEKEKREIIERFEQEGFKWGDYIGLRKVWKTNPRLYRFLLKRSPGTSGKRAKKLIEEVGYSTVSPEQEEAKRLRNKRLQKVLIEELKMYLTPEKIEECINKPIGRGKLREDLEYLVRYELRRLRQKLSDEKLPCVRKLLDSLYPGYPHLASLVTGLVRYEDSTFEEERDYLRERYFTRKCIAPETLIRIENGFHARWLRCYLNRDQKNLLPNLGLRRNRSLTRAVEEVSGIKAANFSFKLSKEIKSILGYQTENLVKVVLRDSLLSDPTGKKQTEFFREFFLMPVLGVYPINGNNESRGAKIALEPEEEDDPKMYVDAVVESLDGVSIVEVKNYRNIQKKELEKLRERFYKERDFYWTWKNKKKKVLKKVLLVFSHPDIFNEIKSYLSDVDVSVIPASDFRESFEITVKNIQKNGYMRTNVYSPEEVLEMYDALAGFPQLLIRKSHRGQLNFLEKTIEELSERLQNGEKFHKPEKIEVYSNKGEIVKTKEGKFQRFIASLEDLPNSEIKKYVRKNLKDIPKNVLFFDLESTGFVGNQIFLMGTAYKEKDDLKINLAFARNPWEERAMLKYFCTLAFGHKVVTYNGKSFDYPATKKRLNANLLEDQLPENHQDLYRILESSRIKKEHENLSLKLIEICKLFGDKRTDIRGDESPVKYQEWLATGSPDSIVEILEHNVQDLVTTTALYLSPDLLGYVSSNLFNHRL